ncbi:hypothetical protein BDK51DRAFT_39813 [Blyttiomyces helicus]|uniref:Uncharacterized protein n=1 Tax=Blyttiomyces helicus TaxID=388810 RepID=A0A4P9W4I6_9FUNG|nr:hypothetical protein BDK51DRAFT_39813 [Blyttiomyces helicus]|eukprot:RKO86165.1 hypothetical protein BDK51DRAFT_39813 [Blyttiomyces helicus]
MVVGNEACFFQSFFTVGECYTRIACVRGVHDPLHFSGEPCLARLQVLVRTTTPSSPLSPVPMGFVSEQLALSLAACDRLVAATLSTVTSTPDPPLLSAIQDPSCAPSCPGPLYTKRFSPSRPELHRPDVGAQLPGLATVRAHLATLTAPDADAVPAPSPLVALLLARSVSILRAHLIRSLLHASAALPDALAFWRERELSTCRAITTAIEEAPGRAVGWIVAHSEAGWRGLLDGIVASRSGVDLTRLRLGASTMLPRALGGNGLRGVFGVLGVDDVRSTVRARIQGLEFEREILAGYLGVLAEKDRVLDVLEGCDGGVVDVGAILLAVGMELLQMRLIIERTEQVGVILKAPVLDFDKVDALRHPPDIASIASSTDFLKTEAETVTSALADLKETLSTVRSSHGIPSALVRAWLPVTLAALAAWQLRSSIAFRWDAIIAFASNARETVVGFLREWVWRPVVDVYETVRHREARLALMGSKSLGSDLDRVETKAIHKTLRLNPRHYPNSQSLERMVIDFARDNGVTDAAHLSALAAQTQSGDLTIVLETYERAMKRPLKGIVSGMLAHPRYALDSLHFVFF